MRSSTNRLTANVGMPHFGVELHDRGPKWIVIRDADIDFIGTSLVRGAGWSSKGALEVGDVISTTDRFRLDLRLGV